MLGQIAYAIPFLLQGLLITIVVSLITVAVSLVHRRRARASGWSTALRRCAG